MLALFRIEVSRETSKYLVIILIKASQDNPIGLSNCRCPSSKSAFNSSALRAFSSLGLGLASEVLIPKYPSTSVDPANQALLSKGEVLRGSLAIFKE